MKRILVFNDSLVLAGTEKLLLSLLVHWSEKENLKVDLLLPCPDEENMLIGELPSNVSLSYLRSTNSRIKKLVEENLMIFFPGFYRRFKSFNFDSYSTVICFKESFYASLFYKLKAKKVLWVHALMYEREYKPSGLAEQMAVALNKKHISKLEKKYYPKFDQVICVSQACKESYLKLVGEHNKEISIVYNGIDFDKIRELSQKETISFSTDKLHFIHITRNSPEKRFDRVLLAVQRLSNQGYVFDLNVIGDIQLTEQMEKDYENLNFDKFIKFHGTKNNPYSYIKASDCLICSSQRESFSLVLLEALCLETMVVSTNCGGPAEILDNGLYGLLVENSADGVYQGMKTVLDNFANLEADFKPKYESAIKRFSQANWLRKADDIFDI